MKKLIYTLVILLGTALSAIAGYDGRSVLEIRLSDRSPLVVSINGRQYNKHGRTVTVGNLPRGRHDIRIYEFLEYKRGGGRARLLFTGTVRIDAGTYNYCVVDVRTQDMRIRTMDLQDAYVDYDDYSEVLEPDDDNGDIRQNRNRLTNDDIITLKARADERITDIEKLKLLKSVLSEKRYTSTQVRTIAGWLAFEDSKLNFAKWSYERVTDPQDYWKLEDIFTYSNSKDEFSKFIKKR